MKIYVTNLARSTDRKAHMLNQLKGIPFEFYEAVDAYDAHTPEEREAACLQTHVNIWHKIAKSKTKAPVLILEDDVYLHDSFLPYLTERLKLLPENWEVAMAGYNIYSKTPPKWNTTIPHWKFRQGTGVDFEIVFGGGYCYVLNGARAAKKLLQLHKTEQNKFPDLLIRDCNTAGTLEVYFMCHPLAQHGGFASTIDHGNLR